ncbi:hypothetical protein GCM10009087_27890 [Sphingomonas oligophenolica]|uniref:DUF1579 domain-containing protein n=1 Tax=Sphingomonas oligophenolica TaxID=301154 RepID=A0ABU9Y4J2_9SPHN
MNDTLDVSGVWYGRWNADNRIVRPNRFIAHLVEGGGQFAGTTSEPDLSQRAGIILAFVEGARAGAEIRFVKQYDGTGRLSHSVLYSGRINGAGTEIHGTWRFSSYSGSFRMERERFAAGELEIVEEVSEQVP